MVFILNSGCSANIVRGWYKTPDMIGCLLEFENIVGHHWGVIVDVDGNDVYMIHLTEDGMVTRADVLKYSEKRSSSLKKVRIKNTFDGELEPFPPEEIVQRAKSKLGKHRYDVLFMNCEHFANWCRYGKYIVSQAGYDVDNEKKTIAAKTSIMSHEGFPGVLDFSAGNAECRLTAPSERDAEVLLTAQAASATIGPVKASFGTAEIGTKAKADKDGIEAGVKLNARWGTASIGRASVEVGPSFDTGVKVGADGVGASFLGVGAEIGKKTNVSLFGIKFGFDFS